MSIENALINAKYFKLIVVGALSGSYVYYHPGCQLLRVGGFLSRSDLKKETAILLAFFRQGVEIPAILCYNKYILKHSCRGLRFSGYDIQQICVKSKEGKT